MVFVVKETNFVSGLPMFAWVILGQACFVKKLILWI